jgi:type IV secretory pathway VirJ component
MDVRLSGRRRLMTWALGLAALVAVGLLGNHWLQQRRVGGAFGHVQVVRPQGEPRALVLLLAQGGSPALEDAANVLARAGAVVGIVDATGYLDRHPDRCNATSDELKWLGLRVLRGAGVDLYLAPMLVGLDDGSVLVRQALAQSAATWPDAVVVGHPSSETSRCGDPPEAMPAVVQLPAQDWVASVVRRFPPVVPQFHGLPLVELPHPGSDRLVILMSGDGGWASLDKEIADDLHARAVAVLGWNSLRYFWSKKTPEQAAADLSAVIAEYQRRWKVSRVDLIGYSFGADVMPFLYARLPAAQQRQVRSLSLLGLSPSAGFTVRIGGWLGWSGGDAQPVQPQLAAIPADKILCVYGEEEQDSLCPKLRDAGIDVRMTDGGHHFDGTPGALTALITDHWQAQAAAGLTPPTMAPPAP